MLASLREKNPEKDYPANLGAKWTAEEESALLRELAAAGGANIEEIAQKHNRTVGGINSRRREIAYKMYLQNVSMDEIVRQTKLDAEIIMQTIAKRGEKTVEKTARVKPPPVKPPKIEDEIAEIKSDIKEIKGSIMELRAMLSAIYEFEDS